MKENKDVQVKFRLTTALKEQIDAYCETHGLNVSQFLRMACEEVLNKKEG